MGKKKAAAETSQPAATAGEVLDDVITKITPYLEAAQERGAEFAQQVRENLGPRLEEASERISPAVEQARDFIDPAIERAKKAFDEEVVPRFNDFAEEAAKNPTIAEATRRAKGASAALLGDDEALARLALPAALAVAKKRRPRVLLPLTLIGLAAGVAIFAWRKLSGSGKPQWETYSATAWNPTADSAPTPPSKSFSEPVDVPAAAPAQSGAETQAADRATTGTADSQTATTTAADSTGSAAADKESSDNDRWGPNSYVGDEPGEGYPIKGNARSMKYHTPDSTGYERTNADVWFDNEDSADQAGFTKAQR